MLAILTYVRASFVDGEIRLISVYHASSEIHSRVGSESEWKINSMSKHFSPDLATSEAKAAQIQSLRLGAPRDQKCARSTENLSLLCKEGIYPRREAETKDHQGQNAKSGLRVHQLNIMSLHCWALYCVF